MIKGYVLLTSKAEHKVAVAHLAILTHLSFYSKQDGLTLIGVEWLSLLCLSLNCFKGDITRV